MMVLGIPARVIRRGLILGSTAGIFCFATACSDSITPRNIELKGDPVPVGNGTARTFVLETTSAEPSAIGVELTTTALDGLPTDMAEWSLPMPPAVSTPPWDHVMINWNPQGHEPTAIYGLPHFDFHFYTISQDEQMQIAGGPDNTPVPAQNVPQDYESQVMSVPMMGVHWADTQSPEFHGSTFDKTFIYGFYQGNMVFVEPMVTKAMLASQPNAVAPVKQPQSFQKAGFYPDQYSVRYDAGTNTVRVTLESLTDHS
jgi:uncharacterized protein